MTLTPPEVASLTSTLSRWEFAEYVCAGLVTIGCIGEYIADFTNWLTSGAKGRKERLAKRSTLLLIAALSLELICLVRTNQVSGEVIGSLDERAEEADNKARKAIEDSSAAVTQSSTAKAKAESAEITSGKAVNDSDRAKTTASNALVLARGARMEADSFEQDIILAKKQATEAEAHLAEAMQRATNAEGEADRIKERFSDRTLTGAQVALIVGKLRPFPGQEFTITTYTGLRESLAITNKILGAIVAAGWKPIKSEAVGLFGGISGVEVYRHPDADKLTQDAADALVAALNSQGIVAELRIESPINNPKTNKIELIVGTKE